MKEILIISGKGGTGKTTVAAALADLMSRKHSLVLADADVDAANLELLLEPTKEETFAFMGGQIAVIQEDECIQCGECENVCRFEAIHQMDDGSYQIDASMCEGCLSCLHQCPVNAIIKTNHKSGEWYRSQTQYGTLFHANLYPGEENSGKLVTQIKTDAREYEKNMHAEILLIDGPPGIGCPVTAACNGVDAVVIVSEPTLTGYHDMQRVKEVADHFHIPAYLLINKCDLNEANQTEMLDYARSTGIALLGLIPYDEAILHAQVSGKPITQTLGEPYHSLFTDILEKIENSMSV